MLSVSKQLLRRRQVCGLLGISKSTLYVLLREQAFPVPLRVGKRAVAWRQCEVEAWLDGRGLGKLDV